MEFNLTRAQILYVMGFAGSGKTTLVKEFSDYLSNQGFKVIKINLDPGAEVLPYLPDFDVRRIVRLEEVMREERLGPNGGLIRSIEHIVRNMDNIVNGIRENMRYADWVLIDTTGQLELFAFRELGEKLVLMLRDLPSVGIFLLDASNMSNPSDIVMAQLVAMAIQLKLGIEVLPIINKIDIVGDNMRVMIELFHRDIISFKKMILGNETSTLAGLTADLIDVMVQYLSPTRLIAISAKDRYGFEELHDILHEVFCACGDLT